jgi:hypothetical protein
MAQHCVSPCTYNHAEACLFREKRGIKTYRQGIRIDSIFDERHAEGELCSVQIRVLEVHVTGQLSSQLLPDMFAERSVHSTKP